MKHQSILLALVTLCISIVFLSCKPKPEPENPSELQETLRLTSTSPAEGAEVVAHTVKTITLGFATPISVHKSAQITLNNVQVKADKKFGETSVIEIPVELEPNKEYTLVVPSGAIRSMADSLKTNPALSLHFTTKDVNSEGFVNNEAYQLTLRMGFGWNLGNHFDSSSGKDNAPNSWGYWDNNSKPQQILYQRLVAAGVKTVRICVTWGNYQDPANNYAIRSSYMDEVAQNVAWARDAGLMVILNTHHDEYWLDIHNAASNPNVASDIQARIVTTWTQIAEHFKNEGDYLIMETFNEVHAIDGKNENWGNPSASHVRVLKDWTQAAVNAIRATGGNNATRYIAISGYAASPALTMQAYPDRASLPTDAADNKLVVAIHCYDPYDFTLADPLKEQWGHTATANKSNGSEKQINDLLQKVKATYLDQNIPCYMGEFGCSVHETAVGNAFRKYYLEYFCRACYFAGLSGCLWDNYTKNAGGAECHDYFDHNDGTFLQDAETLIPMMVDAMTRQDPTYTLEYIYNEKAPK